MDTKTADCNCHFVVIKSCLLFLLTMFCEFRILTHTETYPTKGLYTSKKHLYSSASTTLGFGGCISDSIPGRLVLLRAAVSIFCTSSTSHG